MGLRAWLGGRGRARAEREQATRLAAAEAAQDDPLFDPELVQQRAATLFVSIQRAWSADAVEDLRRWVGPELMVEWEARLADFRRRGGATGWTCSTGPACTTWA